MVQFPDFTENFNRYAYALNNPLKFTDPSGENPILFIAGFVIGAYLAGAAYNNWDFTPWDAGAGDDSWAWSGPGMYMCMLMGGIAGGSLLSMGWSFMFENYSFNLSLDINLNNLVGKNVDFLVSNSEIIFEGMGYFTATGGGYYFTDKIWNGIDWSNVNWYREILKNKNSPEYVYNESTEDYTNLFMLINYRQGIYKLNGTIDEIYQNVLRGFRYVCLWGGDYLPSSEKNRWDGKLTMADLFDFSSVDCRIWNCPNNSKWRTYYELELYRVDGLETYYYKIEMLNNDWANNGSVGWEGDRKIII